MRRFSTTKTTNEAEGQAFIKTVLNRPWEQAQELYDTLPDYEFAGASALINTLVKQFKNDLLERVLIEFKSLDLNKPNRKGQPPILVAFNIANERAAVLLRDHGANVLVTDSYKRNVVDYAKWSKCNNMVVLAKSMLEDGMKPKVIEMPPPKDFKDLASKFIARRQGGVTHYPPDFES